jgi:isocitrate dehydrogenase kinase/phosphatase
MHCTMRAAAASPARPPPTTPARAVALALLAGFDKHYALFRDCARAAKRHFETGQFLSIVHVARDRIDFYDRRVSETAEHLRREFGAFGIEGDGAEALWTRVRPHYVALLAEHRQPECAETFFNSVSCRLLDRDYFHNGAMFVRPAVATEYLDAGEPAYRSYYPRERGLRTALIDLILDFRLERASPTSAATSRTCSSAFRRRLPRPFVLDANFQIQVLSSLFFRNRSAYIVGRVVNGAHSRPFAVSIRHAPGGDLYVDALLADPLELALLFSANRAYFLVDMEVPSATVEFLRAMLPDKTASELYTIVGLQKHGKTLFFRDFLQHLRHSTDRFVAAPGHPRLVMAVFTLPSYPYVFKLIKDRIAASKDTDRARVTQKYALVKHHDRAGRMTDILEYSDVTLPRERFAPALLDELCAVAPSQVSVEGDWVLIRHVYIERRLTPLNMVLDGADDRTREHALDEYGRAIRELAAVNIFAGDLLFKNFGLTRYGRVVFYDYDEIEYMTDCAFRTIPTAPPGHDEMSGEVWYRVGPRDMFPEEFATFLLTDPRNRMAFMRRHAELLDAGWWQRTQAAIRASGAAEVLSYGDDMRFAPPDGARRTRARPAAVSR